MATNAQFVAFGPYFVSGVQQTSLKVYHYTAGTTTLLNVYTARDKSGTAAQPLASDSNGIASCYADGIYKFRIDGSSDGVNYTTLYTYDSVTVTDGLSTLRGKGANLTAAATLTLGTDGDYFKIDGATGITSLSGAQPYVTLEFNSTPALTYSGNLILSGGVSYTVTAGTVIGFVNEGSNVWRQIATAIPVPPAAANNGQALVADTNIAGGWTLGYAALRSYLAGLTLSTAGSSGTMSIAAGAAADSTNVKLMILAAFTKTTSAWAVGSGNGGIDAGSIANTTWYHWYLIYRPDTQVVDVTFSTNATTPALPANYTLYRRIGSGKTDGSAHWILFTQDGDYFRWSASVLDINSNNPGTNAVTNTLGSVPTGVTVHAILNVGLTIGADGFTMLYVSDLSAADEAPSSTATPLSSLTATTNSTSYSRPMEIRTNTSAQVRSRLGVSSATVTVRMATLGWKDRRGRDA